MDTMFSPFFFPPIMRCLWGIEKAECGELRTSKLATGGVSPSGPTSREIDASNGVGAGASGFAMSVGWVRLIQRFNQHRMSEKIRSQGMAEQHLRLAAGS